MRHNEPSKYAGKIVRIREDAAHPQVDGFGGSEFLVEDWWDRVSGGSWMFANGNPAALVYALRSSFQAYPVPIDDEVLYGKIGMLSHLVHVSEIQEENHGN
ncbi:MAG TPA: hypothetical protein VFI02_05810 [Armatimonadota bacterium]|nr:hypothetical protein [Armatimonadota bacterium]